MIVYATRPDTHRLVSRGLGSVLVWTDEPHFYHTPVRSTHQFVDDDVPAVFNDQGWMSPKGGGIVSRSRFIPLAKQNDTLRDNAWRLILWSCIPESEGVSLDDVFRWGDDFNPGSPCFTNFECLSAIHDRDIDLKANVHHKRFLMSANLLTGECALVDPMVHYSDNTPSGRTNKIPEFLATRRNYRIDQIVPF